MDLLIIGKDHGVSFLRVSNKETHQFCDSPDESLPSRKVHVMPYSCTVFLLDGKPVWLLTILYVFMHVVPALRIRQDLLHLDSSGY